MSKISLKSVQKEVEKLEKELEQKRGILALLGGKSSSAPKRKRAAKKAAGKAAKAAPKGRAPKRLLTAEHLEIVAKAIGEQLPAIELKSKIDGRVLRALPLKQAIAKLRKLGRLTSTGEKRQLVYVRATPAAPASASTETSPSNGASTEAAAEA